MVPGLLIFLVIVSLASYPQARMLDHYHKLKLFSAKDAKDAKFLKKSEKVTSYKISCLLRLSRL